MRPPRSASLLRLTLLIASALSICCSSPIARAATQTQLTALTASPASAASPETIAPSQSSRSPLIRWIATPDAAVTLLCVGVLLLFAECNLPGAIVPGALGLLLALSGIYGLLLLPLRPLALLALLASAILLALSARIPLHGITAVAATTGLVYSLWTLIDRTRSVARVHPPVALCAGLLLGISASLLGRVAMQARRNKTLNPLQTPQL